MRDSLLPCSGNSFSRAPVAPVYGHTVRYCLAKDNRNRRVVLGLQNELYPRLAVVCHVCRTNLTGANGAKACLHLLQRVVPPLARQPLVRRQFRHSRKRSRFCGGIRMKNSAVIVAEYHRGGLRPSSSSAASASRYGRNSRRPLRQNVCWSGRRIHRLDCRLYVRLVRGEGSEFGRYAHEFELPLLMV